MKKVLCFMAICFFTSCSRGMFLKSSFPKLKWDTGLKDQKMIVDKEFQEKSISGMKIKFEGDLKNNQLIAETMTDVDPEKAEKLFKNKSLMIKGLYSIQATPYSGTITKEASCMAGLNIDPIPSENKIQTALLFNLKATERLVLGVCLEEQNMYRNQTLLLYCKSDKTFYDLRYYYPKASKVILVPIASCVN